MLRELALLAALLAVSAAARLKVDEPMGSSSELEMVTELQDEEKSDDSEELQTNLANDVSINDEDEQLREALYGTQTLFVSSEISSMSKSPYVGVMGAYLARKYLSSSSVLTQEELHAAGLSCSVCVKAVDWAVPKITKWGWACTGVLIGSCSVILQQIRNKVASSKAICQTLRAC
ncbi:hypothetical protein EMCRGX_G008973 [Ephydatia muelleri]